ncbi:MAG: glycoside hydrolase family 9 protein [Cytophagaceae bacterium]|jgi:hypothetical protein|nr:glycoside hydrolase family 9 protein [Cytophagaceae bacterium]
MTTTRTVWPILLVLFWQISNAQISEFIVVDQFGYTTGANKVAVIRDPQTGYDASLSFTPGSTYALVSDQTNTPVFTASISAWNGGATDASSGDRAWWFDFSSVTTEGSYYVKDLTNNARSATFVIADTVYKNVLKASLRMLYYQRSGYTKLVAHAGNGYAHAASHVGPLQDKNARLFNNKVLATEKDLYGGWYDAGDYNQYTPWTANYVVTLLLAYLERPEAFTDDYMIPESGNGVPDVLDEVKWALDWLLRMSQSDGSSLCVLGRASGSPPSSATGESLYGPATTNATLRSASAFALGAKVFKQLGPSYASYAATLESKAIAAWDWAVANPSVTFANNSSSNGSQGLAAGNQETDNLGRNTAKIGAATFLYDLTGGATYKSFVESNYTSMPLFAWSNYASQYFFEQQDYLMYYISLPNVTTNVVNAIRNASNTAFNKSGDFFSSFHSDPYRAFVKEYNWGSNQYKSVYGNVYTLFKHYDYSPANNETYDKQGEEYLHYIHGVNPLSLCYLTNMSSYGAEKSINEIYHTWFSDGSSQWDRVGVSTYGPAPGFLAGGPNSFYDYDDCCPNNCGSTQNNALCTSESISPPKGQPVQKSYKDFNTSWPLNSWEITEPSLGYQTAYIRLLSKYTHHSNASTSTQEALTKGNSVYIFPNPSQGWLYTQLPSFAPGKYSLKVVSAQGRVVQEQLLEQQEIQVGSLPDGMYLLIFSDGKERYSDTLILNKK